MNIPHLNDTLNSKECWHCNLVSYKVSYLSAMAMHHFAGYILPGIIFTILGVRWALQLAFDWTRQFLSQLYQSSGLPDTPEKELKVKHLLQNILLHIQYTFLMTNSSFLAMKWCVIKAKFKSVGKEWSIVTENAMSINIVTLVPGPNSFRKTHSWALAKKNTYWGFISQFHRNILHGDLNI